MQVFEHDDKVMGFGVRTLKRVLQGTFIAEYVGEILTDIEADKRSDDSYVFAFGSSKVIERCLFFITFKYNNIRNSFYY